MQVRVLVIGDQLKAASNAITDRIVLATGNNPTVTFCSDKDFCLTRLPFYCEYDLIVFNWDKFAYLIACFLRRFPFYPAKLILFSAIFKSPETPPPRKYPTFQEIDGYGIFDYYISARNDRQGIPSPHTWEQVVKELQSVEPRRASLKCDNVIGFLLYKWRSFDFGPGTHLQMRVEAAGKRFWSEDEHAWSTAFDSFESVFKGMVREVSKEMDAKPIWGEPTLSFDEKRQKRCFVLMPFSSPFEEIYQDHIKPTVQAVGLKCVRADDVFSTNPVMQDIWTLINNSHYLIAELTGRNANVMYELGIAHTIGKDVILICQNTDDVPFDFRHLRYYRYEYTPRGCTKLAESLRNAISELLRKP
jgi:hypothetical protein